MNKLEKFKIDNGFNTSEEALYIEAPVDFQCDFITEIVTSIDKSFKDLKEAKRCISIEGYDDAINEIEWAEHRLDGLTEEVERIRECITSVRKWGQEWKDLAKSLLEDENIDIEKYL